MAEAIPTRPTPPPAPPPPPPPTPPWTPEEQAQHRADLAAALDGWTYRETQPNPEPHLRLVTDEAADTSAA
ncbi:hypothetical protein [Streptomyces sp. BBFR109]|uniref:hypothetical protein n=1 Tax=Streptomyces sp. BBFR109 TaxID=3448172 RepID=UPI003F757288